MLWTGKLPVVKELEENMAAYINSLQGFILLSHGSTVGAGPTLSSCILTSVKQVVDSSLMLMKESVTSYGNLFCFIASCRTYFSLSTCCPSNMCELLLSVLKVILILSYPEKTLQAISLADLCLLCHVIL